jgi:hypothetical protein
MLPAVYRACAGLLLLLMAGCDSAPSAGPEVQQLLDEYAPGLTIGSRVSADAHKRYELQRAAYCGYTNAKFQGPDGVHSLEVCVSPAPLDGADEEVKSYARISTVLFEAPPDATDRLDARLRALLGEPSIVCYTDGYDRPIETRWWRGSNHRGVMLTIIKTLHGRNLSPRDARPAGSSIAEFGARSFPVDVLKPEECR